MDLTVGQKLKILRKGRGLTQEQLSERIDINRSTLCNYETDRRQIAVKDLTKIANFFGVGLDYFGVASKDEIFDLVSKARNIFENRDINRKDKEKLYKSIMRLYLAMDEEENKKC